MKLSGIKLGKETFRKLLAYAIAKKRLFFALFFGMLLIYTFKSIYENAYVNIYYINYQDEEYSVMKEMKREDVMLSRIISDTEERKKRVEEGSRKRYRDPFDSANIKDAKKEVLNSRTSDTDSNEPYVSENVSAQ